MKKVSTDIKRFRLHSLRILSVLTVTAVIATGCGMPGGKGAGPAQAQLKVRAVQTEAIAKQSMGDPIEQVADVAAGTAIDVVPKANGQVVEVLKKRGEYVEAGDVLFRIDSEDAESTRRKNELSLQSTQVSLQKAKDDQVNNRKELTNAVTNAEMTLQDAEQNYNKVRNNYDAGTATQHDVEQAKQTVDTARNSLDLAKSKLAANDNNNTIASYETQVESNQLALEEATRSLEDYSVKAPGSGILTDFDLVAGQTVSTSSVGKIQQIDPVKITTELSETNYQLVKNKQEVVFYNPDTPENKQKAKISYLAPIMSATTKTYTLELEVANSDHKIQPGARFMVQLTTEDEQNVLAVPTLSIIREESDAYVFIQDGDHYTKRKVKLGRINGTYQEVLDGVKEGELLVITGQGTMKDGQKVESAKPSESAQPSAAPAAK